MSCERYDERLLLHAHGQLDSLGQLVLLPHLLTCAACRSRLATLRATSLLLMQASAVPGEVGRRNGVRIGLGLSLGLRLWLAAITAITASCLIVAALLFWNRPDTCAVAPRAASSPTPPGGCIPGLPSDRCR